MPKYTNLDSEEKRNRRRQRDRESRQRRRDRVTQLIHKVPQLIAENQTLRGTIVDLRTETQQLRTLVLLMRATAPPPPASPTVDPMLMQAPGAAALPLVAPDDELYGQIEWSGR